MRDSSDELSTADLAAQSAGSGAAEEPAVRDERADRTGERPDGFPADRATDAGYAEGSDAHTPDHVYADEGGHGTVDNAAMAGGGVDNVDRHGNFDNTAVSAGDEPTMTTDRHASTHTSSKVG